MAADPVTAASGSGPTSTVAAESGSAVGSGRSRMSPTRSAAARSRVTCCAAGASPAASSCTAIGVRATTASATPGRLPARVAAMPVAVASHTAALADSDATSVALPIPAAERPSARRRRSARASTPARCVALAPATTISGAPRSTSSASAASSPRSGAIRRSERRATVDPTSGAAITAPARLARRARPAAGTRASSSATAPAPTIAVTSDGRRTRGHRSTRPSTSPTSRATRSPERSSASPIGARRSRRRYVLDRSSPRTRSATSCVASRST